jgi:Fic family protein
MQSTDTHWNMLPNQAKALMLAKRQLSELVYDAVNLEGINFTLPEVQTLLDGVTVGGRKLSDQQITLNQAAAWRLLFKLVEQDQFEASETIAFQLHKVAAKEEALEWGQFRTGGVLIAGTDYSPPSVKELPKLLSIMISDMKQYDDVYDQAIHLFLTMARCQFFYDVNKRMGRFMMNGHLLIHGYPVINLPASKQQQFNENMLRFYSSGDQLEMNSFMRDCMDARVVTIMKE